MFRKRPIVPIMLGLMISTAPVSLLADDKAVSECPPMTASESVQVPDWVKQRRAEMERMREQFAAQREAMMARQMVPMQPYQPAEVPEWVSEHRNRLPMVPQMPEFDLPKVPEWVAESRRQRQVAPFEMHDFKVPEWVAQRRAQQPAMRQMPVIQPPQFPSRPMIDQAAMQPSPSMGFEPPELPEWVKERRARMAAMPQLPAANHYPDVAQYPVPVAPAHGLPVYRAPVPYYGRPYPRRGWGVSDWGPFDGMGDLFGDMDMSFNFNLRGSGSGYGDGRGYHGYGYGPHAWPPLAAPTEITAPAVAAVEAEQSVIAEDSVATATVNEEQPAAVEDSTVATDSDGDGVLDIADICPDSPAGAEVDGLGCEQSAAIVLRGVNFKTDSDQLTDTSTEILDRVANTLIANPTVVVEIAGHTDSDADEVYNKDLSQRRAEMVMSYLTEKGVIADNLSAMGYGEEQPIASNETAEGKAQNRSVELVRNN
ncbi:MAG: OmpA family protein [Candidatus Thiodiazotropha taylori]